MLQREAIRTVLRWRIDNKRATATDPKHLKTADKYTMRTDMARDPVCGMTVNEGTAKWTSEHEGKTYYFCNERCKLSFEKAPSKFIK